MLLVAGDRDEFLGGDRRRPGVCRLGGVGRRRRRATGVRIRLPVLRCGVVDRIVPVGGRVAGPVMGRVVHGHGRAAGRLRNAHWPVRRWRDGRCGAGGSGPGASSGERSGAPFFGRVPAKPYVTRVFALSVRVCAGPSPVGLYGSPPGNRLPTVLSGPPKKSLDQGTAEFAKNRVRTIREVPCPAGSARSRRASGTVDPYRRYLRYGTFKGPSSLRSRVGVGTVRPTWLIRPAAKFR